MVRTGSRLQRLFGRAAIALAAAASLAACGGAKGSPSDAAPGAAEVVGNIRIGELAPELQVEPLAGRGPKTLADARGKIVLVDLWATFCKPCKALLPKYQQLVDRYEGKLVVIAVSVDEPADVSAEQIKAFTAALGLSFSVVWDRSQKTVSRYDPPNMPTSYLIDGQGVVREIYPGTPDEGTTHIRAAVDELLQQQR